MKKGLCLIVRIQFKWILRSLCLQMFSQISIIDNDNLVKLLKCYATWIWNISPSFVTLLSTVLLCFIIQLLLIVPTFDKMHVLHFMFNLIYDVLFIFDYIIFCLSLLFIADNQIQLRDSTSQHLSYSFWLKIFWRQKAPGFKAFSL